MPTLSAASSGYVIMGFRKAIQVEMNMCDLAIAVTQRDAATHIPCGPNGQVEIASLEEVSACLLGGRGQESGLSSSLTCRQGWEDAVVLER